MYALVGEFIEAYTRMGSAMTEYIVGAIGPPRGGEGALREAIGNSPARDRLLAQYGERRGLEIKYSRIGKLRKTRNALAHNIVGVGKKEARATRGGRGFRIRGGDLRRYISEAREIASSLESRGGDGP